MHTDIDLEIAFVKLIKFCRMKSGCQFCFLVSQHTVGRSTSVGQRPMKSLSSVCLSVCPSVRPSLNFLKIEPFNILHNDRLPLYLVTDEARFLKKIGGPTVGPMGLNQAPKIRFFVILLSLDHTFSLKIHTMIAYNNV